MSFNAAASMGMYFTHPVYVHARVMVLVKRRRQVA